MSATNALLVLYDPRGGVTGTGERGPLWSSDCPSATSLKALCGELLMAGWPLSTMLKLPDADEPERFSDVYKREFGQLPKGFERHKRAMAIANYKSDRPDYGTTPGKEDTRSKPFGGWVK